MMVIMRTIKTGLFTVLFLSATFLFGAVHASAMVAPQKYEPEPLPVTITHFRS
jgi:hypothetical protein